MLTTYLDVLLATLANPTALMLCVAGVVLGLVLGAIPGISSTMALAILLPVTFGMAPPVAILFLIAVFVSSVWGGSISAILIGIPGTPASIFTQIEGYPMARTGRAGVALTFSLVASTVGGLIGLAILVVLAPLLASVATSFRSPEFAAVALFGLVILAFSANGQTVIGIVVSALGLLLGMVGFDSLTDAERMTAGNATLQSGIGLIPVIIGLFGLGEIMKTLATPEAAHHEKIVLGRVFPPLGSLLGRWGNMVRSSVVGTVVGAIPATGSAVAVSIAYAQEQRFAKDPTPPGKGNIDGLVAPEAANSACVGGALIPLMALGLPGDTVTAVLMGALMIHGLQPGPLLFVNNLDFVASVYVAVLLSIVVLLVAGLAMIRWVTIVTRIPSQLMQVFIALFCVIGAFAIRNDINDIYVMAAFGGVAYVFHLLRLPVTPLAFGLILGPIFEENIRRSLILSQGDWMVFLERPITLALILISLALVLVPLVLPKRRTGAA